jgi:hypothetical protein
MDLPDIEGPIMVADAEPPPLIIPVMDTVLDWLQLTCNKRTDPRRRIRDF